MGQSGQLHTPTALSPDFHSVGVCVAPESLLTKWRAEILCSNQELIKYSVVVQPVTSSLPYLLV